MKSTVRFFTFILVISIILSTFSVVSAVSNTDESIADTSNEVVANTNDIMDYDEYLAKNSGKLYNGEPIITDLKVFTSDSESELSLSDYANVENTLTIDSSAGTVEWNFTVPEAALYEISVDYIAVAENENKIEASVFLNGKIPFDLAENISLPRLWKNEKEIAADEDGNDITPAQIQFEKLQSVELFDINGLHLEPLKFYLQKGTNKIAIKMLSGKIAISKISLKKITKLSSYKEYFASYKNEKVYDGADIVIQGQDAVYKSSKELRPISDKSDPANTPVNAFKTKINCIGGNNWDSSGEKITWEFNAPADALYTITFNYRQSYLTNASSIRALEIDGKPLFAEASELAFEYTTGWNYKTIGKSEPYKIFLEEGPHTISLEVSLGEISEISRELEKLVYNIGELYRQIIMITGTSPDANRDYRLYEQIPDLNDNLIKYKKTIDELVERYNAITGAKGGSSAVTLEELARVLERMQKSKFESHEYVGELFNNYSSVSAWVYEMRKMPLDIEKIVISGDDFNVNEYKSTFTERFVFGIKKLLASFIVDYTTLSSSSNNKSIDLWVNLGRDQANVLSNMIKDSFTPKHHISVNVKIATANMIQAKLSGNAPDCTIMRPRSQPVNLAMRGALYDLSKFDDLEEVVMERYGRLNIITPYMYKEGVYGLPDTETYPLMYVRNDIFEQLDLKVPKTWDEFLRCAAVIMRNNLSVGLPQMYTTFLYQFGGQLYNEDLTATALQTPAGFSSFEYYCDLYTEYKLPTEFSFYNRFRTGEMPLGISPHTDYATLMAAAPEITGMWSVYQVPGMMIDGKINNTVVGGGTACVMLDDTDAPEATWEFLKWWTDAETQYRYSSDVESIAGVAARHSTANIHALSKMSWGRNDLDTIVNQFKVISDLPQVPGGYYLDRAINNAFYSVYSDKEQPKKMLVKWSTMVDEEMTRKIKEYS